MDEKISQLTNEKTLISPYMDLKIRPINPTNNFTYATNCSSLLFYLALADAVRSEKSFSELEETYYNCLFDINDENAYNSFLNFVKEAANLGGYAKEFYKKISKKEFKNSKREAIITNYNNLVKEYEQYSSENSLKKLEECNEKFMALETAINSYNIHIGEDKELEKYEEDILVKTFTLKNLIERLKEEENSNNFENSIIINNFNEKYLGIVDQINYLNDKGEIDVEEWQFIIDNLDAFIYELEKYKYMNNEKIDYMLNYANEKKEKMSNTLNTLEGLGQRGR